MRRAERREGDHDGIGGEGAAIEQLGHAGGVSGCEPERAQGGGLWWAFGQGSELPVAGGALPEGGGGVRREHQVRGRGVVAESAAGDGSAGVDLELEAGAGLGVVAVEDAEVGDVGGGDLGGGLGKDGKDFKDGKDGLPGGRRRTSGDGGSEALGDGDSGGAGGEESEVGLSGPRQQGVLVLEARLTA